MVRPSIPQVASFSKHVGINIIKTPCKVGALYQQYPEMQLTSLGRLISALMESWESALCLDKSK